MGFMQNGITIAKFGVGDLKDRLAERKGSTAASAHHHATLVFVTGWKQKLINNETPRAQKCLRDLGRQTQSLREPASALSPNELFDSVCEFRKGQDR